MSTPVITGLGHYHPETVLDNAFFDTLDIGSSAAWIEERTGIHERRSVLTREQVRALSRGEATIDQFRLAGDVQSLASMCRPAWSMAAERAAYDPEKAPLKAVICGTSTPDFDAPANACAIAGTLGLVGPAFDVASACSSFVVDLHVARSLLATGNDGAVAVFNPDRFTTRVDYRDRTTCILWGDAAAATIVEQRAGASGLEILDTLVGSDAARHAAVTIRESQAFMQDGRAVQKFAITRTVSTTRELLARNGLAPGDLTYLICHQANLVMLESVVHQLELTPEQHLHNAQLFGNQGGAGAPTVLSMHWERLKPGDLVAVVVVGAGLTWAGALLRRT